MRLVSIGKRTIPVVMGSGPTLLYFSAGVHGKKEAGWYRFWTCHGEDEYGEWAVIGRARTRLDPGDRFARMAPHRTRKNPPAHQRVYARMFKLANRSALCIRPSTEREVARWVASHKKDCAFLSKGMTIRGRKYKTVPRVP